MPAVADVASRRVRRAVILVALGAVLAACGKKGPPQPPVRVLPATPGPIATRQVGEDVLLSATLRVTRTDGSPLPAGTQVQVMRMPAAQGFRPGLVSERYLVQQFQRTASTIATLDPRTPEGGAAGRVVYRDRGVAAEGAGLEGQGTARGLLYGLRIAEPGGKSSAMRAPILVELARPPAPPGALEGEAAEGEVRLRWPAGSGASAWNVYRKESSDSTVPDVPLNAVPLNVPEYIDRTFRYDVEYEYFVRSTLIGRATPCESPAGPIVTVKPHDHFAPAAPTGIAVAVEGDQIRVYWFPNAESDLAGYRIYRRAGEETESRLVGEVGPTESAWSDTGATPGVRYHYSVSAIDGATPINEGPRSEERSERLPADAGTTAAPDKPPGAAGARR